MAEALKALAALSKDFGLTPSSHVYPHGLCHSSPRGSNTFFRPLETTKHKNHADTHTF